MVEAGGDLNLAQKPGGADLCGQIGAEHLHGDRPLVLEVVGEEDLGHAALTQLPLNPVARGEGAGEPLQ